MVTYDVKKQKYQKKYEDISFNWWLVMIPKKQRYQKNIKICRLTDG